MKQGQCNFSVTWGRPAVLAATVLASAVLLPSTLRRPTRPSDTHGGRVGAGQGSDVVARLISGQLAGISGSRSWSTTAGRAG